MYLAKVIGNVVATKKSDTLLGYKLMIIQPVDASLSPAHREQVAADFVGAGVGEYVLVGTGSSVRVEENRKGARLTHRGRWRESSVKKGGTTSL